MSITPYGISPHNNFPPYSLREEITNGAQRRFQKDQKEHMSGGSNYKIPDIQNICGG